MIVNTVMRILVPVRSILTAFCQCFQKRGGAACSYKGKGRRRERIHEEIRGRAKEDLKLNLYEEGIGISSLFTRSLGLKRRLFPRL